MFELSCQLSTSLFSLILDGHCWFGAKAYFPTQATFICFPLSRPEQNKTPESVPPPKWPQNCDEKCTFMQTIYLHVHSLNTSPPTHTCKQPTNQINKQTNKKNSVGEISHFPPLGDLAGVKMDGIISEPCSAALTTTRWAAPVPQSCVAPWLPCQLRPHGFPQRGRPWLMNNWELSTRPTMHIKQQPSWTNCCWYAIRNAFV